MVDRLTAGGPIYDGLGGTPTFGFVAILDEFAIVTSASAGFSLGGWITTRFALKFRSGCPHSDPRLLREAR